MNTQVDVQPERTATEPYASVLEELNSKMQSSAEAALAFAPPQTHGDLTVIPVARVRSRFGGGFGTGKPKGQESVQGGVGAGGTLSVIPVGYIEMKEGRARFRPIITPDTLVRMQVVGGTFALMGVVGALLRRRGMRKGSRKSGLVFNAVFSPGAALVAGKGRARRRLRGQRSRRDLRQNRTPAPPFRRFSDRAGFLQAMRTVRSKAKKSA